MRRFEEPVAVEAVCLGDQDQLLAPAWIGQRDDCYAFNFVATEGEGGDPIVEGRILQRLLEKLEDAVLVFNPPFDTQPGAESVV